MMSFLLDISRFLRLSERNKCEKNKLPICFKLILFSSYLDQSICQDKKEGETMTNLLSSGTLAPDFSLPVTPDQSISLKELRGQPVILAFYPADWSPVCSDEITLFNEVLPEFRKHQAELLGISVDGYWCHTAFSKHHRIHFPLLSDFEPKGAVAKQYGAYLADAGVCKRALFVLDKQGMITWSYVSPIAENPGADGILEALEKLEVSEKVPK